MKKANWLATPQEQLRDFGELFEFALAGRDAGMARVEANAGEDFSEQAQNFTLRFLSEKGPQSGEAITNAAKEAGICPHNDKAFGAVYMKLARHGQIEKIGIAKRLKGHATSGANIWKRTVWPKLERDNGK